MLHQRLHACLQSVLSEAFESNEDAIVQAAGVLARAIAEGKDVYAFGAGHSLSLVLEMHRRAGGVKVVRPIWNDELRAGGEPSPEANPETTPGYAATLTADLAWGAGDVVWVISNSGRNPLPVELALSARDRGVTVIGLVSRRHADVVPASPGLPKLTEVADIVLDNRGEPGDACLSVDGVAGRMAPTSTIVGAALVHAVWVEAAALLAARGEPPEVYVSFNLGPLAAAARYDG
jgi:uncharacterized phosphosugar-binding protein